MNKLSFNYHELKNIATIRFDRMILSGLLAAEKFDFRFSLARTCCQRLVIAAAAFLSFSLATPARSCEMMTVLAYKAVIKKINDLFAII